MMPESGLNWIADLHTDIGLGEAARLLHRALNVGGIPYHHVPIEFELHLPIMPAPIEMRSRPEVFPTSLMLANADVSAYYRDKIDPHYWQNVYRIGYWFWELQDFPAQVKTAFQEVDEVWVASTYTQSALSRISPVPIVHMPLPIYTPPVQGRRADFGLPQDQFVFFFSFSPLSSIARKNPFAVIEAFKRGFAHTQHKPCLVIKAHHLLEAHDGGFQAALQAAIAEVDGILITDTLDRQQTFALMSVCDAYVSLHRSEGWGLGMAEAMALGKPVIATGYSGNLDFMTHQNSALVNYHLRAIQPEDHHYQPRYVTIYEPGQLWAEPDVDHAAWWMQRLVNDPSEAQALGRQACQDVAQHHSPEKTAENIVQRLAHLPQRAPHFTLNPAITALTPMQHVRRLARRPYELAYGSRRVVREQGVIGFIRQTGHWIRKRLKADF